MSNSGVLDRRLARRLRTLNESETRARSRAATTAARVTRATFGTPRRPGDAPPRPGRAHAGGNMLANLVWEPGPSSEEAVRFDLARADARAPYWIVQEIGTNATATLKRGGSANPRGRPGAGASYSRRVPSQRGRLLPSTLAFGTSPTGAFTPFGRAVNQQLYLRSALKGAPVPSGNPQDDVGITKEIPPRHMVARGGEEGFREYRTRVLAAARQAFAGTGRRP